jgi:hypothetical protein
MEIWERRRGRDWKKVERDLYLRQQPDGSFHLTMKGWRYDGKDYTKGEWPFCTVNQDDIVTVLLDHRPDQAEANRLSTIIGCNVVMDASNYRNHESTVRVCCGETWRDNKPLPYTPGSQFKVYEEGTKRMPDYLNPPLDLKIIKSPEMRNQLKNELDTIRKLTYGMARMGSFDTIVSKVVTQGRWNVKPKIQLKDINYAEPTGDDAETLFTLGIMGCTFDRYAHEAGGYRKLSDDELVAGLRQRASANGIKKLREYLYADRAGFIKVPAKAD